MAAGNNAQAVADNDNEPLVAGNNNGLPAADNSGDGGDHVHDVPNRGHGVPTRHQHETCVKTGLQRRLMELKKITFS